MLPTILLAPIVHPLRMPLVLTLLTCFYAAFPQVSPVCFHAQSDLNTKNVGQAPKALVSSDLNGDGVPDIVTSNFNSGDISLLLSLGNGNYGPAVNVNVGSQPAGLTSEDFNGDGNTDLAVAIQSGSCIVVLMGSGTGSISTTFTYNISGKPNAVTASDFNNDGKLDLAVTIFSSGNFALLLNNGSGSFNTPVYYNMGSNPAGILASDFNGDGNKDVAVSNSGSNDISVRLGNGTGSFGIQSTYSVGNTPQSLAAADFDGDNKIDLAVANFGAGYTTNQVSILLGSGLGTFSVTNNFTTTPIITWMLISPSSIQSGDFDSDGKPDLAVCYAGSNCVSIRLGTGSGTFGNSIEYGTAASPSCLITKDINLDGFVDLVTANTGANNVSIFLGSQGALFCSTIANKTVPGQSSATGDFNEDGHQDVVIAHGYMSFFRVHLGDGTGRLFPQTGENVPGGGQSYAIIADDLDSDSHLDVVICVYAGAPYLVVYYGYGDGSFTSAFIFQCGTDPTDIVSGDFNEDGFSDLATTNSADNDVSILTGFIGTFGFMNFSWPYLSVSSGGIMPSALTTEDFNGDGHLDLAISNYASNNVSVRLGTGTGTFVAASNYSVGLNPISIKAGNLNGDTIPDLVVANYNSNNISILLGTGNGIFATAVNYQASANPRILSLGDFNDDGQVDIAVPNSGSDKVSILSGTGMGTFNPATNFGSGQMPNSVSVADFNEDGRPDIVTVNATTPEINVLLNGIPVVTLSAEVGICLGNSITIQAAGASTYSWNTGATTSAISVSPLSTTVFTVTGRSLGACISQATKTVFVSPNFTISAISGSICAGGVFSIAANNAFTYTYSGGSSTVSPAITTSYSVTGTNSLGCVAVNTVVVNVSVSPLPKLTITSSSDELCANEFCELAVSGADFYSWNNGANDPVILVNPPTTTIYTVTGNNANGCASTATFVQTVKECARLSRLNAVDSKLVLYPNPAQHTIQVQSPVNSINSKVVLLNMLQAEVFRSELSGNLLTIDVSDLPNGIYLVHFLENNTLIGSKKLVKN